MGWESLEETWAWSYSNILFFGKEGGKSLLTEDFKLTYKLAYPIPNYCGLQINNFIFVLHQSLSEPM